MLTSVFPEVFPFYFVNTLKILAAAQEHGRRRADVLRFAQEF
jgi:hypothetical protein